MFPHTIKLLCLALCLRFKLLLCGVMMVRKPEVVN